MTRQPVVLLAWEMGQGLGHVQGLRRIALRLAPHGIKLVAAVRNLMAAADMLSEGVEILQAPIWPEESLHRVVGMADILANFGLADKTKLQLVLSAWDGILDRVRPNLILADYAPGVTLATRGRVPVIQMGASFAVPPETMEHLPNLIGGSVSTVDQAAMLDTINAVVSSSGRPPLARIGEVFAGVRQIVKTFPLLDIYAAHRAVPAVGPSISHVEESRGSGHGQIFAYLNAAAVRPASVRQVLRDLAPRLSVFAPELRRSPFLSELGAAGATIHHALKPLGERLRDADLFIHYGSASATAEALAAGTPQLAFAYDMEKLVNGTLMQRAGVGEMIKVVGSAADVTVDAAERIIADVEIRRQAIEQGRRHRAMLRHDPLGLVEEACLTALARP